MSVSGAQPVPGSLAAVPVRARGGLGNRRAGASLATVLVMGLILVSGNPVLSGPAAPGVIALLVLGATALPRHRTSSSFSTRYMAIGLVYAVVFAAQWLLFGFVSLLACAFFLVKLLAGGYVIHRIGERLGHHFMQATYLLSVFGLIGYAAVLLVGPTNLPTLFPESLIGENLRSLFFITAHVTPEWWRNSGPMWEPGAYQGVINLALLLAPTEQLFGKRYRWRLLVLIVALLTTFSTTGYVVFFLVAMYKILRSRGAGALKVPLAALVVSVAVFVFFYAEFLGQKITEQVANAGNQEDFTPDRFGALLFDIYYIEKSPWVGNGFHESTRFADHPYLQGEALGHGNGLSNFTASLGLIGLGTYLLGLATSRFGTRWTDRIALVTVVAVLAFGEQFLLFPLFLGLPFISAPPRLRGSHRAARQQRRATLSPLTQTAPAQVNDSPWPTPTPPQG